MAALSARASEGVEIKKGLKTVPPGNKHNTTSRWRSNELNPAFNLLSVFPHVEDVSPLNVRVHRAIKHARVKPIQPW